MNDKYNEALNNLSKQEKRIQKLKKKRKSFMTLVIVLLVISALITIMTRYLPLSTLEKLMNIAKFIEDNVYILLLVFAIPLLIQKSKNKKYTSTFTKEDFKVLEEYHNGEHYYIEEDYEIVDTFDRLDSICLNILVTYKDIKQYFPVNFTIEEQSQINKIINNKLPGYEKLDYSYKLAKKVIELLMKYYDESGNRLK